jgi:mannose-1-phosphate guanylyltransferase/mannose-6-phosphate isomerase
METLVPVILSGGFGSRLWPMSRKSFPKQMINLVDDRSLLQATLQRVQHLSENTDTAPPILVINEDNYFVAAEQLQHVGLDDYEMILEPMGRNTAAAIALAAFRAREIHGDEALLLIMPADHLIHDIEKFTTKIQSLLDHFPADQLLTFGVKPTKPHTGYGYIKTGRSTADFIYKVEKFAEKPDQKTAENYLLEGNYFWNSGLFLFQAGTYLQELKQHAPEIHEACEKSYEAAQIGKDYIRIHENYQNCPDISVDYALMEKTQNACVTPLDTDWSDVGDWSSLADVLPADENGNVVRGDVIYENSHNCYLHAENRLLAVVGIHDQVIVETKDAILIAHKNHTQDVRKIVKRLQDKNSPLADNHHKVHRPWGSYESIANSPNFQVKHIILKVGGKISLQKHEHRAEHWVVVDGTAEVIRNEEIFILHANESTFIPPKTLHRLSNIGEKPLHVIEVQSGNYLGEDDIIRYEDQYGRKTEIV